MTGFNLILKLTGNYFYKWKVVEPLVKSFLNKQLKYHDKSITVVLSERYILSASVSRMLWN